MECPIYESGNGKESNLYSHLNDSLLKQRPFYHTGFEEGLEKIVMDEEPEREKNVIEKVFSDKSRTLKATIKALFNEILVRERLDYVVLSGINEEVCRQHSYLEGLKMMNRHNYSIELLNDFNGRKLQLEDNVIKLQEQKRKEYLECWKDLLFLKKYLLSALKDYWNAHGNRAFLEVKNDERGGYLQETEAYNWRKG